MMRIAYISGEQNPPVVKPKKRTKNDAFMEEVKRTLEYRHRFDEQRAEQMFEPETEQLEKLKTTLNKLKNKRDEVLQ